MCVYMCIRVWGREGVKEEGREMCERCVCVCTKSVVSSIIFEMLPSFLILF